MPASNFEQFKLLTWKNIVLARRKPCGTWCSIVVPCCVVLLLALVRLGFKDDLINQIPDKAWCSKEFSPLEVTEVPSNYNDGGNDGSFDCSWEGSDPQQVWAEEGYFKVLFHPDTPSVRRLRELVIQQVAYTKVRDCRSSGVPAAKALNGTRTCMDYEMAGSMGEINTENEAQTLAAAIVFRNGGVDDWLNSTDAINVRYEIRMSPKLPSEGYDGEESWETDLEFPEYRDLEPLFDDQVPYIGQRSNGFLFLQSAVDYALATAMHPSAVSPGALTKLKKMPFPAHEGDFFLPVLSGLFPLVMVLSFIYPAQSICRELVVEKEHRLREAMNMMGLPIWINWAAWAAKWMLQLVLTSAIITIIFSIGQLLRFSNPFIVFMLLFFFCMAIVAYGFFMSTFFSSGNVGGPAAAILFFLLHFPYMFLDERYAKLSNHAKRAVCLGPPSCFASGMRVITYFELRGEGIGFHNMNTAPSESDTFTLADVIGMLFLDTLLLLFGTWYLGQVLPSQYGVPKSPWFCFAPIWNLIYPQKETGHITPARTDDRTAAANPNLEPLGGDVEPGIAVKNLYKVWDTPVGPKTAVDGLTVTMPKGQISVLLGHNGAGKTTTMSIMTGLYTPTEGDVEINGYSVANNIDMARTSLGLCPQFDILFDNLTVEEHLYFFLKLKGVIDPVQIKEETTRFVEDVDLVPKQRALSKTLSGGQKRALSCAIALIGGSKTVILDEPTSGMDPEKRRHTWDLLLKHKEGRTILLTTHFMDEADILGDRIAIMSEGKLGAVGSSLFLKQRFGEGYHLTISKTPGFQESKVKELMLTALPSCKIAHDVGTELSYVLPKESVAEFPKLYGELESRGAELGIDTFGTSCSTMEEVFLKVGELTHGARNDEAGGEDARLVMPGEGYDDKAGQKNTGAALWLQQFKAMFTKKMIHTRRHTRTLFAMTVVPAVFVFMAFAIVKWAPPPASTDECRQMQATGDAYVSVQDTGYDSWTGMDPQVTADYYKIGNSTPTPLQTALGASARAAGGALQLQTSGFAGAIRNGTAAILHDAEGYNTNLFYEKHMASVSYATGTTWLSYSAAEKRCTFSAAPVLGGAGAGAGAPAPELLPSELVLEAGLWYQFSRDGGRLNSEEIERAAKEICVEQAISGKTGACEAQSQACASTPYSLENLCISEQIETAGINPQAQAVAECVEQECKVDIAELFEIFVGKDGNNNGGGNGAGTGAGALFRLSRSNSSDQNEGTMYPDGQRFPGGGGGSSSEREPVGVSYTHKDGGRDLGFSLRLDPTATTPIYLRCSADADEIPVRISQAGTAEFTPPGVTAFAWYNPMSFHSPAESLNFASNAVLKQHLDGVRVASISTYNCPLPKTKSDEAGEASSSGTGFGLAVMLMFGLAFLSASFILFPVNDRVRHSKHIQFVSGANEYTYWLSSYAWDLTNFVLPVVLILVIVAAFDADAMEGGNLGVFAGLLVLFAPAILPMLYVLSFLFSNSSSAYVVSIICFFFLTFVEFLTVFIMRAIPSAKDAALKAHLAFLVTNPVYCVAHGTNTIYSNYYLLKACTNRPTDRAQCDLAGVGYREDYLDWDYGGVGKHYFFLVIGAAMWFAVLFLIEFIGRRQVSSGGGAAMQDAEDDDVAAERRRVEDGAGGQDQLVVQGLTKKFSKMDVPAVSKLSFAVPSGQCFGLLGVNGAGKTSTFRMLTGEIGMSAGNVTLNGLSVRTQLNEIRQHLGYCPQYDGLVETMSGREILSMFGRLRGVPEASLAEVVQALVVRLDLTQHCDRLSGTYSGGNKRKLSTAIALVGSPDVVFLDEPTSGMDPGARRQLWSVLDSITKSGKSIVMTSHSMEECESLCDRIGIMKDGRFMCLGSPQHLKSKFGKGYTLIAKIGGDKQTGIYTQNYNSFLAGISAEFAGAKVTADVNGELTMSIPENFPLSVIFRYMEANRGALGVIDYSLAQTTLEQVFLAFASGEIGGGVGSTGVEAGSVYANPRRLPGTLPAGYIIGDKVRAEFKYGPDGDGEVVNPGDEGQVIGKTDKPGMQDLMVAASFPGIKAISVNVVNRGDRFVSKVLNFP